MAKAGDTIENPRTRPPNTSIIIPRLVCRDPAAEIDFCVRAFEAVELNRRLSPDGSVAHALLTIGPEMIMVEAEWPSLPSRAPTADGTSPVVIFVYVPDVDQTVARASACGAKVLVPLTGLPGSWIRWDTSGRWRRVSRRRRPRSARNGGGGFWRSSKVSDRRILRSPR